MGDNEAGRPRDAAIDIRIVEAAQRLMAEGGVEALSFVDVAARADTTRPAVYRRYSDRTSLAVAAIAALAGDTVPPRSGDLLEDLAAELTTFREGLLALQGLGIAGAVLGGTVDVAVGDAYRRTVVTPRRTRIAEIIATGVSSGELVATVPDQEVLVTMCTGSWYAFALAGTNPGDDWPHRTARLVLAAAGRP